MNVCPTNVCPVVPLQQFADGVRSVPLIAKATGARCRTKSAPPNVKAGVHPMLKVDTAWSKTIIGQRDPPRVQRAKARHSIQSAPRVTTVGARHMSPPGRDVIKSAPPPLKAVAPPPARRKTQLSALAGAGHSRIRYRLQRRQSKKTLACARTLLQPARLPRCHSVTLPSLPHCQPLRQSISV